ncbi:MAG: type IV pili methyl-accepting chemotaxis transducer N-terminal domain-containing protein [Burkholderiales bacterium]|nr:type IV pili methyl-accepting chemotaxis transducer N-terminal domain-containing protein [Burkholderiales bacterium]
MKLDRRFFAESLVVRLGIALATIVTLALAAAISATVFTELSTGKAAAINGAGSLRMQSYWITVQVLRAAYGERPALEVEKAAAEFETRLSSAQLKAGLPGDPANATRRTYERVATEWSDSLRPGIARALAGDEGARDAFVARAASFVQDVDNLVSLLEYDLEGRIQTLKVVQGAVLFATIVVMFIALYLLHAQVLVPLADLLQCARRVRVGEFAVRARHVGEDELGQLGQSFNYMMEDLSRSYATLEARVFEKTEQLARSNASLEVLYNTTRALAENPLSQATLERVVREVERAVGLEAGVICAREEGDPRGFPITVQSHNARIAADWCGQQRCAECLADAQAGVRVVGGADERALSVPLSEGGTLYGVMLLRLPPGAQIEDWKLKLLESIGHHIGAAIATAKRADERRRIALMEERSVIARELHDSLAQSLSYLKIQVTRLQSQRGPGARAQGRAQDEARFAEVVEELKAGLNNAYRQLRELLTTFRLRMDGRGIQEALREAVREFSTRTGLEFQLQDQLLGHELDSSEQIHVLQVVREALTNVEHHARARRAEVRLAIESGRVRVTVDDDGVGIAEGEPPAHHYGLAIMRDRAATLGGALRVLRRAGGGTRVELEFAPRGPFRTAHAEAVLSAPSTA